MTVLQQIIEEFRLSKRKLPYAPEEIISVLQSFLPAEQQQIRDAMGAGYNWRRHKGKASEEDIEEYIANLASTNKNETNEDN